MSNIIPFKKIKKNNDAFQDNKSDPTFIEYFIWTAEEYKKDYGDDIECYEEALFCLEQFTIPYRDKTTNRPIKKYRYTFSSFAKWFKKNFSLEDNWVRIHLENTNTIMGIKSCIEIGMDVIWDEYMHESSKQIKLNEKQKNNIRILYDYIWNIDTSCLINVYYSDLYCKELGIPDKFLLEEHEKKYCIEELNTIIRDMFYVDGSELLLRYPEKSSDNIILNGFFVLNGVIGKIKPNEIRTLIYERFEDENLYDYEKPRLSFCSFV